MNDLLGGEASCRLIEYHDPRLVVDSARDFDHLSLGCAEDRYRRRGVDMEVKGLQAARLDIESTEAGQQLFVAELDVLGCRH